MKTNKPKDYEKIHYWLRKNFGNPKVCENTECEHFYNHLTLILNKYPSDALVCWSETTEDDMLQYAIPSRMI